MYVIAIPRSALPMKLSFKKFTRMLLVAVATLVIAACGSDNDSSSGGGSGNVGGTGSQNIVELAVGSAPEFSTLVSALQSAGLVSTLSGPGPFTVFAPTNAAFAAIQSTVDTLSISQLTAILNYHVVPGINSASSIPSTTGTAPAIGNPIDASNGVIFPIDQVLLP